ncbi:ATP-dependent DNA helicase [Leuconostoc mesenteroides]|uniref:ATP-dependent DNA helicase n=1 Tax=Leuconostoc mesenteroides TaxID=1245 RepID=UPI0023608437|nr:helicase C-terminal domain-containing protein [Leuconostoc mesenteroides]
MKRAAKEIIDVFEKKLTEKYNSRPRHSQVQMAMDVYSYIRSCRHSAFRNNKILFAEAPVGTGKSLGALVPSIIATKISDVPYKGIIYATATIGLQSQLWHEEQSTLIELELLKKNEAKLAMGKTNFACFERYMDNRKEFSAEEQTLLDLFFDKTITGLKDELIKEFGFDISFRQWDLINIPEGKNYQCDCVGHKYRRNLKKNSCLTITNQQQLLAAYKATYSGEKYTPILNLENKIIVVDEAHEFQSNFLEANTYRLRFSELKTMAKRFLTNNQMKSFNRINSKLRKETHRVYSGRGTIIFKNEDIKEFRSLSSSLSAALKKGTKSLHLQSEHHLSLSKVADYLETMLLSDLYKVWYEFDTKYKTYELCYAPKKYGEDLRLFLKRLSEKNALIFMSGTLTANSGTQKAPAIIAKNWYLKQEKFILQRYASIFEWDKQIFGKTMKKTDPSVSNPSIIYDANRHCFRITHAVIDLAKRIEGGILVLTTSLEYKDKIGKRLLDSKLKNDREILIQKKDESQNPITVAKFKQEGNAILVGSGSYYTGFSVPGRSLQALVISKLPFPIKSDPLFTIKMDEIISLHSENRENQIAELKYFLMFSKLEQGIGRLIRTTKDYGTLVVEDPRVISDEKVAKWFEERDINLHNDYVGMNKFYQDWQNDKITVNAEEYVRSEIFENRIK